MKNEWHIITVGHLTRNIFWGGEDNGNYFSVKSYFTENVQPLQALPSSEPGCIGEHSPIREIIYDPEKFKVLKK